MKKSFPNRLREVREHFNQLYPDQKISQIELARRSGTTRQTIARIEKGQHEPSISLAQRIVRAFGSGRDKRMSVAVIFPIDL